MDLVLTLSVFLLAGLVKGTVGLGLPLVSVALLTPLLGLGEAKALILIPAVMTNVVQAFQGPAVLVLARRLAGLLVPVAFVGAIAGCLLAGSANVGLEAALGLALLVYVALALTPFDLRVPPRHERFWAPAAGVATGIVVGATGVLSIPSVVYLRAIGLQRDTLVQAMGLAFAVGTLALAAGLASAGALAAGDLGRSAAGLLPALAGMFAGARLRRHIPARTFQRLLLAALAAIGLHLLVSGVT